MGLAGAAGAKSEDWRRSRSSRQWREPGLRALGGLGQAVKSKVARVLPGGRRNSAWWRWMRRSPARRPRARQGAEQAGGGPAFLVGALDECCQWRGMLGRRRAVSRAGRRWMSTVSVMPAPPCGRRGRASCHRRRDWGIDGDKDGRRRCRGQIAGQLGRDPAGWPASSTHGEQRCARAASQASQAARSEQPDHEPAGTGLG